MADQSADGSRLRALTIVDVVSREALAIDVGQRLRAENVVAVLKRLVAQRRAPKYLFAVKGSEFPGRVLDIWAYHCKVRIDFSRPGKPTDNSVNETFNGSFRDECLNLQWFASVGEAKLEIEAWLRDYNENRPHIALNDLTPGEFARKHSLRPLAEVSKIVEDQLPYPSKKSKRITSGKKLTLQRPTLGGGQFIPRGGSQPLALRHESVYRRPCRLVMTH